MDGLVDDTADNRQSIRGEMFLARHHAQHPAEAYELDPGRGLERISFEERYDPSDQITAAAYPKSHAIPLDSPDHTTAEEVLEFVEHLDVPVVEHDHELGQDLIADLHLGVTVDSHMETSQGIHEPGDPTTFEFHCEIPLRP